MTREFWNETWAEHEDLTPGADDLLVAEMEGLTPGRALDIGCGAGGNAVWLAEHGWQVTATDFADAAIEKGKRLAAKRSVQVEFVVADIALSSADGVWIAGLPMTATIITVGQGFVATGSVVNAIPEDDVNTAVAIKSSEE